MTNNDPTAISPSRRLLAKATDLAFGLTLAVAFTAGAIMVLCQLVAVLLGASSAVETASGVLGPVAYAAAAAAGVLSLGAMYLHRWSVAE